MDQWAKEHNLTEETLRKLVEDGYDSLEELSQLTPDEVDNYYARTLRLKKAQCSRLKKALEALNEGTTRGQNVTAKYASSHGDPARTFQESAGARNQPSEPKRKAASLSHDVGVTDVDNQDDGSTFQEAQGFSRNLESVRTTLGKHSLSTEMRLLLVGKTGVGKSTTGNTILGNEAFGTSSGLNSETSKCEVHSRSIFGRTVEVTDTPGLFDTSLSENTIAKIIVQAVACMHPGPHVFLFLVKLGCRFTQEDVGAYKRLTAIFNQSVTRYMIILFTGGDSLGPGQTITNILEKAPEAFQEILQACENRYVVFDNQAADKKPQVKRLLRASQELIEKNTNKPYSCPKYFFVQEKINEEIQKRMSLTEKNESELKGYTKNLEKKNQELEETRAKFEELNKQREEQLQQNKDTVARKVKELERKLQQNLLSSTEKEVQEANLRNKAQRQAEELKKNHEKDEELLKKKERRTNEEVEKIKTEFQKAQEKTEMEELKKFKDAVAKNEERGWLEMVAAVIAEVARAAWSRIRSWIV